MLNGCLPVNSINETARIAVYFCLNNCVYLQLMRNRTFIPLVVIAHRIACSYTRLSLFDDSILLNFYFIFLVSRIDLIDRY